MGGVLGRWLVFGVAVSGVVCLAACGGGAGGGSGSVGDPPPAGSEVAPAPGSVVARVGDSVVTGAMFEHWLGVQQKAEHVAPPGFAACIARLRARAQSASSASAAEAATLSVAQLRVRCGQLDQVLHQEALSRFIVEDWVTGGARELGVAVGGREFERKFAAIRNASFHTQAQYRSYLRKSGRTSADVESLVRMELDSQAIREAIERRVGPITAAKVRRYYDQHKSLYFVPETRDLEIAGTGTRAEALAVKRQVTAGKSFASIVEKLPGAQPLSSNGGLVLGLASGFYKEPELNQAIFAARPGVLSGPIKTTIGYYVFKVKRIHPAFQKPLAAVAASIKTILPGTLAQQELVDYIKGWRAKWTARTDCSKDFVIQKCRQFKTAHAVPEDPYTLN